MVDNLNQPTMPFLNLINYVIMIPVDLNVFGSVTARVLVIHITYIILSFGVVESLYITPAHSLDLSM